MAPLVWLVTGTTSGIGAALVNEIVARGDKVIASGRKANQRLGHLKSDNIAILDLDITAPWAVVQSKINEAWNIFGNIDLLLNNAGASALKCAEEADDAYVNNLFQVNLFGHMNVTRAILPRFRAQGHGIIGFTSSASSWGPLPFMSHYAASKAALSAYIESLHKEVRPFGISCVGFMCGSFPTNLGHPREEDQPEFASQGPAIADYGKLMGELGGMFARAFAQRTGDLEKVASAMVDVMKGEGIAAGKPWAVSVALGSDAFDCGAQKCHEQMRLLKEWEDVSYATDREGHDHVTHKEYLDFASML
ncbi:ketoreductase [Fusarium beomiforme]|uniref:Ketoreductase n=1 Tax=Fusarium beomiforme TaxID=44412 RepID=A0A9P5AFR4_9HYPO|nr:ketoreductase [Fusarium beomiforme]